MKKSKVYFVLAVVLIFNFSLFADEGMWIPSLLSKYNEEDMIKKGLKISAEDIYSINHSSLKDAIVLFGRGCTAEVISEKGLILTNHHCGYGQIQAHSSVEHDYLTNGYWASSMQEELVNPGLSVKFLIRMEDVTDIVLKDVTKTMSESERSSMIRKASSKLINEATSATNYIATVKPLYYGNQYFIYVMQEFKDIRFVGAPPSAIGKFGGDTDNWMWPRHTGDFSLFRIYSAPDGSPAKFSKDNIPLKAEKHLKISLKGVKKNDFTMVYGYPYTTQEYLPSYAVEMIAKYDRPVRVSLRNKRLEIMAGEMKKDAKVRIQYSSKYAGVANGWKKWQGVLKGLDRIDAIEKKKQLEKEFTEWAKSNPERMKEYGNVLPEFEKVYKELTPLKNWTTYFFESVWGIEIVRFAANFRGLSNLDKNSTDELVNTEIERLRKTASRFYKDYNSSIDKKIFYSMVSMFYNNIEADEYPPMILSIQNKFDGDIEKYSNFVFEESFMTSQQKLNDFLDSYKASKNKKITNDPVFMLMTDFISYYRSNYAKQLQELENKKDKLMRDYMRGLMEMQKDKLFYPDANATMRLTYGKVDTYEPKDAITYTYFTTLKGIMEKDDPNVYDYDVPEKLKELYENKDYGKYAEDGKMHICFLASNHTTGGNSGSPVLNAYGHLIGLNFDRNWEGTMSDIMYDPKMCRNISLDIRYFLFIVDKFAGAGHLVEEMDLVE
ncbi:MAG: S46 family peptidase [Bacteroidota bacterium]|nr:S46 family peptidase [Bacteroidota bacterium]